MINMMEKVPTRVNTQTPFTNFARPKTCTDPPFLYMRPAEPWSFWAANSTAICKRICAFPLNVAFILCGLCKEHSEKQVSRKNIEGKGWGVRVVKTPLMVLFNKSSLRILPDRSGIPGSGKRYEWFILTALVNIRRSIALWKCEVTAMGSSVRRLTLKKVRRPLALLAASRPKMPAPRNWFNCMYYVYFNKQ